MLFGVVLLVVASIGIRFLSAVIEGATSAASTSTPAQPSHRQWQPLRPPTVGTVPPANPIASVVVEVKHSLETGVPGEFLRALDPVPKGYYETIGKVGQVASRPDALRRIAEYPGTKELVGNPEIAALREDPEIAREIVAHDYLALLKNKRMLKTCNDPKLAALLRKFDVEKALDFALSQ